VQPQVGLGLSRGARSVDLSRPPRFGVVAKQSARPRRVDVEAVGEVTSDAVEEWLGVAVTVEVARLLAAAARSAGTSI
jgi:hypothetical protein